MVGIGGVFEHDAIGLKIVDEEREEGGGEAVDGAATERIVSEHLAQKQIINVACL